MTAGMNSPKFDIPPDIQGQVTVTSLDKIYNWGRRSSIWPMMFGLACCAIEMICTAASRYDLARFRDGSYATESSSIRLDDRLGDRNQKNDSSDC